MCRINLCPRPPAQERVSRAVRHSGEPELRLAAPRATAAVVVQSALSGGGEDPRPVAGRRRQVPAAQEVPAAQDHMGRRGDRVLFQGEVAERAQGLLPEESVPDAGREARPGQTHRPDAHAGQQLVQEPAAARPDAAATQVGNTRQNKKHVAVHRTNVGRKRCLRRVGEGPFDRTFSNAANNI